MGFAKDTQVTMADGSRRYINEIHIGDHVMSDGMPLTVINIFRGQEEALLQIVVENSSPIRLLPDSVVITVSGAKRARLIVCGDMVQCEDVRFSAVQEMKTVAYDDSVYHLCFGQKGIHFANGAAVGSFEMEQELT